MSSHMYLRYQCAMGKTILAAFTGLFLSNQGMSEGSQTKFREASRGGLVESHSGTEVSEVDEEIPLEEGSSALTSDSQDEQILEQVEHYETNELYLQPVTNCVAEPAIPWAEMNELQKHVAFFDLNGDGKISLFETYRGFRDLGVSRLLSFPAAIAINGVMATPTAGYPSSTIHIKSIAAGIHGGDTGLYGDDGRFVPEMFEYLFHKWDKDGDGALNVRELTERWYRGADLFDFFGVIASGGEFSAFYLIAAEHGKISKERMRSLYDGSLFYRVAAAKGKLSCRVFPNSTD